MVNSELPAGRSEVVPTGVLVLYGAPPTMKLVSSTGKSLDKVFELTGANRASFEVALRRALSAFLGEHVSVAAATMIYIRDVAEFADALAKHPAARVIYYGHAIADNKVLLPSLGKSIAPFHIVNALNRSRVRDFDILGCSGASIAAEVALGRVHARIGYLRSARHDNIIVDPATLRVKALTIDPQSIQHFEATR
jgi:hypothetical protein